MAECITTAEFMAFFCPRFRSDGCPGTGAIEFVGAGLVGDTITIGTLTATAIAGARAAGSLTWTIGGSAEASATSFAAMLADSAFVDVVTASRSSAVVSMTTFAKGWLSLLEIDITGDVASYSATAFSGGTELVDTVIASACRLVGACFGSNRKLAQYYLAAHMLTGLAGRDLGQQVSAAINAISAGFAATSFNSADAVYASTPYGRQYLLIRKMTPQFGFGAVVGSGAGGGCGC